MKGFHIKSMYNCTSRWACSSALRAPVQDINQGAALLSLSPQLTTDCHYSCFPKWPLGQGNRMWNFVYLRKSKIAKKGNLDFSFGTKNMSVWVGFWHLSVQHPGGWGRRIVNLTWDSELHVASVSDITCRKLMLRQKKWPLKGMRLIWTPG